MNSQLANNMKALRLSANYTMQQLGDELGISAAAICRYENGKRDPCIKTIQKYIKFFGISYNDLLG